MTSTAIPPVRPESSVSDEALAVEQTVARAALTDEAWEALVHRLNRQSIDKSYDAYLDITWDHPDFAVELNDPRWIGAAEGIIGDTDWWATRTEDERARLGLHLIASRMRAGLEFENILTRGLLAHALTLPNGSPEFRYAYHEAIEESQHSLMFQEFVNRTGLDTGKMPRRIRMQANQVVGLATRFPELFFVFILGGEDPIDHVQREGLRAGIDHPLLERIMRIHVTEEARHLSFARHQLKRSIADLSSMKRAVLAYAAPLVLSQMANLMLGLPEHVIEAHNIPDEVVRGVANDPDRRIEIAESLTKVHRLLDDCGLITERSGKLWSRLHLTPPAR